MSLEVEKESLAHQVERAEQECRLVLPGIQALFGFQLIAVFNAAFFEKLGEADRELHLVALLCSALAALLIMTPAAFHRQTERGLVSKHFVDLTSNCLCASMVFLAIGISLDVALIAHVILDSRRNAATIAGILFLSYLAAWFIGPHAYRRFRGGD